MKRMKSHWSLRLAFIFFGLCMMWTCACEWKEEEESEREEKKNKWRKIVSLICWKLWPLSKLLLTVVWISCSSFRFLFHFRQTSSPGSRQCGVQQLIRKKIIQFFSFANTNAMPHAKDKKKKKSKPITDTLKILNARRQTIMYMN